MQRELPARRQRVSDWGRQADAAGEAYWIGRLEGGASRAEIVLGFTDSQEYRAATHAQVLIALAYIGLLGRAPDAQGYDYWLDGEANGVQEAVIVGGFIGSQEYIDRFLP